MKSFEEFLAWVLGIVTAVVAALLALLRRQDLTNINQRLDRHDHDIEKLTDHLIDSNDKKEG